MMELDDQHHVIGIDAIMHIGYVETALAPSRRTGLPSSKNTALLSLEVCVSERMKAEGHEPSTLAFQISGLAISWSLRKLMLAP